MKVQILFIAIAIMFQSCTTLFGDNRNPIEKEMYRVLGTVAKEAKEKYNIEPIGTGISSPEWVLHSLSIDFQVYRPLTQAEIKEICGNTARRLRDEANASMILSKQMEKYPFTIENVGVSLYINDKNQDELYEPQFCIGQLFIGKYFFKTQNKNNRYRLDTKFIEEYSE